MAAVEAGNNRSERTFATEEHPTTDALIIKHKSPGKGKKCLTGLAAIVLLLLLLGGITILVLLLLFVGRQPPRVLTTSGTFEGTFHLPDEVFSFKGIPYALPPIDSRRWQPPVDMDNVTVSEIVQDAKEYSAQCIQMASGTSEIVGDEDCLYLNVFTPEIDPSAKLPVMVYIHGGYLQWGNASTPGYCPDEDTAKQLGVVIVSIQYRLNAFGFLVLETLPGRKGNYGLLDQIEALKWVKRNIRNFGGDPGQVTIFGQSSGGTSVFGLMTTPMAKGLFHKAWMLSASPVLDSSLKDAAKANRFFTNKTRCTTEKCLLKLSPRRILEAIYPEWDPIANSMDLPTKGYFEHALVVVDGDMFPLSPFEMWEKKRKDIADVPVVVGTTAQEVDVMPLPGIALKDWNQQGLTEYVERHLDPFGTNITNTSLALYPYERDAEYVFTTMTSDIRMTCGNDLLSLKAAKAQKSRVYRYVVDSFPSSPAHLFGNPFPSLYAFHSWDCYAFFDTFRYILSGETRDSDEDFGDVLRRNIMHFVRKGTMEDSEWGTYPGNTALISNQLNVVDAYHKEHCDFWLGNGFFPYSWIN